MWEAYGLENEDILWASTAFLGGIAGQQEATCGALAAGAIALGLRHRTSRADKKKAEKARRQTIEEAATLAKSFQEKFGAVSCIGLTGIDFSDEAAARKAFESGELRCDEQAEFVIEKLYELEKKRRARS